MFSRPKLNVGDDESQVKADILHIYETALKTPDWTRDHLIILLEGDDMVCLSQGMVHAATILTASGVDAPLPALERAASH